MKIIFNTHIAMLIAMCLTVGLSSCENGEGQSPKLLSEHDITFAHDDTSDRVIDVSVKGTWNISPGYPEWVIVRQGTDNTLYVSVAVNTGGIRETSVTVTSGKASDKLNVRQLGASSSISFSVSQLVFPASPEGPETVDVIVDEGVVWTINSKPDWIEPPIKDGNTLSLTATSNDSWRMRRGELIVKCGNDLAVLSLFQPGTSSTYTEYPSLNGPNTKFISPNGKYLIGNRASKSFIHDTDKELADLFGSGSGSVSDDGSSGALDVYSISNGGMAVGCGTIADRPTQPLAFDYITRSISKLDLEEAFDDLDARGGGANSIDAAGKTIVGYVSRPENSGDKYISYAPAMWRDNKLTVLDYADGKINGIGAGSCIASKISGDGTRIVGFIAPGYNTFCHVGCYWDVNNPGEMHIVQQNNPEFFLMEDGFISKTTFINDISYDGKVIVGDIVKYNDGSTASYTPFYYNIETGDYFILGTDGYSGTCITPDNTIVMVSPPRGEPNHNTFVLPEGSTTPIPMETWLLHNYGLVVPSGLTTLSITGDGGKLAGYTTWNQNVGKYWNPFVITF